MAARKSIADRFWAKVNKNGPTIRIDLGPCWEWTGSRKVRDGHGQIFRRKEIIAGHRKTVLDCAHRVSWEIANGCIPDGLWVLHRCDWPPCVNPAHLFLGTASDNTRDAVKKGRIASGPASWATLHRNRYPRGESHYGTKLTDAIVRAIRADRRRVGVLAAEYGVSHSSISMIRSGKRWSHIA